MFLCETECLHGLTVSCLIEALILPTDRSRCTTNTGIGIKLTYGSLPLWLREVHCTSGDLDQGARGMSDRSGLAMRLSSDPIFSFTWLNEPYNMPANTLMQRDISQTMPSQQDWHP